MDRIGRFKLPRRVARVMKHVGAADGGSQDDEDYDALDGGSTRCHYTPHRFELAAFSLRFWTGAAAELDYPVSQQSIVREPQPTIGFQPLSQFARCDAGPFYLCPRQFAFTSVGDCAMLVSRWGSHPRQRPTGQVGFVRRNGCTSRGVNSDRRIIGTTETTLARWYRQNLAI